MHTSDEFKRLALAETNARKRIRLLALAHFADGLSRTQIAKYLKVSRRSVNVWVTSYLDEGLLGLNSRKPPGRPPQLTQSQLDTLAGYIRKRGESDRGGRLQATDIQKYIQLQFDVHYEASNIYRLLHAMGFSWITSRSRHPKQDQAVQEAFKKPPYGNDP